MTNKYDVLFDRLKEQQMRDVRIYQLHKVGMTMEYIAKAEGLTRQRVAQIIHEQAPEKPKETQPTQVQPDTEA